MIDRIDDTDGTLDRRSFIKKAGYGAAGFAAAGAMLAACTPSDDEASNTTAGTGTTLQDDITDITEVILSQSDLPEI
ncbi:MAG: hypothetical protein OEY98_07315, partial [Acidimicrobiia bacterium]|nr:hypothetical protein [Acidimicrobiia bacterium]